MMLGRTIEYSPHFSRRRVQQNLFDDRPRISVSSVGAATTMVTEMIRAALEPVDGIQLTEAESTLLALGIHADTGLETQTRTASHSVRPGLLMVCGFLVPI